MMIPREIIEEIVARTDIGDLIGSYVSLKRAGSNMHGLCPFHSERTPSFTVFSKTNSFYCFGCGAGGDSITFVMKAENLDYPSAVEFLATRAGITIPQDKNEVANMGMSRKRVYEMNLAAAKFFRENLFDKNVGADAMNYLAGTRKLSPVIIKRFGLGYAPNDFFTLTNHMKKLGFSEQELIEGFLCGKSQKTGRTYDYFRNRVIFPIISTSGDVIAFGGRVMRKDDRTAKYLNSPESPVYSKTNSLYGLYFAKAAITKHNYCILVEGYTDVIQMHQKGIENVVASSGTSLTTEQIQLLRRFTHNITVIYDGDSAGIHASLRGIDMILKEGMNVRVVLLPPEHDPDSFARAHSATELQNYIKDNEQDFISFKAKLMLESVGSDPIKRSEVIRDMVQSIVQVPDSIKRAIYIQECARIMSIDEQTLTAEDKAKAEATVQRWVFDILGLENEKAEASGGKDMVSPLVTMLLDMRLQAKADKNWALSDEIRDKLIAIGIRVKDRKDGYDWEIE